jgi:hypothetical protein
MKYLVTAFLAMCLFSCGGEEPKPQPKTDYCVCSDCECDLTGVCDCKECNCDSCPDIEPADEPRNDGGDPCEGGACEYP